MSKKILFKFPTTVLEDRDSIIKGWLVLHKEDGFGGPAVVTTIPCNWNRDTVTYTTTMDFTGAQASVAGAIPDGSDKNFNLTLQGNVLNTNRVQGDHFCLQLQGGPTGSFDLITSELVNLSAPLLKLEVRQHKAANLSFASVSTSAPESSLMMDRERQIEQVRQGYIDGFKDQVGAQMLEKKKINDPDAKRLNMGELQVRDTKVADLLQVAMAKYMQRLASPAVAPAPAPAPNLGDANWKNIEVDMIHDNDREAHVASLDAYDGVEVVDSHVESNLWLTDF